MGQSPIVFVTRNICGCKHPQAQADSLAPCGLNCSYFWFPPSYWHLWEEGVPKSRALAQDTGKDLASLAREVARLCSIPFHSINDETKTTKTMETTIKTTMQTIMTIMTITMRITYHLLDHHVKT